MSNGRDDWLGRPLECRRCENNCRTKFRSVAGHRTAMATEVSLRYLHFADVVARRPYQFIGEGDHGDGEGDNDSDRVGVDVGDGDGVGSVEANGSSLLALVSKITFPSEISNVLRFVSPVQSVT